MAIALPFAKYHGAGNDFIMVDQRVQIWLNQGDDDIIATLCHRRFGIGADGLILLQAGWDDSLNMIYFNADGRESTLCGNGARCFAAFAKHLGIVKDHVAFHAIDGPHEAYISSRNDRGLEWVELHMNDVNTIETTANDSYILNTGSPHYIAFHPDTEKADMVAEGRAIRYSPRFEREGINVNLATPQASGNGLRIRTYERGVEDETLACGTGITAAALAFGRRQQLRGPQEIPVQASGGQLSVRYTAHPDGSFTDIWLCGPAQWVFDGVYWL